jgi:cobalt/nickel transport system ATP-binding protein
LPEPLIEVDGLGYTYADGTSALHGVTLAIAPAEKVGLVGPNGSGKSTLLMCLCGLLNGDGTVRIEGHVLTPRSTREVRSRLGLIFQNPDDQLFMPTLAEDLAFGPTNQGLPRETVDQRVTESATQMQLADLLDRAPHHLSFGQKRNAGIATVLAMHPAALLMDEPTSSLDPRSRRRLIDVLAPMDAAMLIASHDLPFVGRLCERVIVIDEGRIVAEGPTRGVLGDAALMERHGLEVWPENGQ